MTTKEYIFRFLSKQCDWYCFSEKQRDATSDFTEAIHELIEEGRIEATVIGEEELYRIKH